MMYACGGRRNPWKEVVEWWFNGGQCSFNALVGDFGVFHRDKYVIRLLIFSKSIVYIYIYIMELNKNRRSVPVFKLYFFQRYFYRMIGCFFE